MENTLLILQTLLSILGAVILIVWTTKTMNDEKFNPLIPISILLGISLIIIGMFNFHLISKEMGRKEVVEIVQKEIRE